MLTSHTAQRDGSYQVSCPGGPVVHFKRSPSGRCRPLIVSHSPAPSDSGILPLVGSRTGNRLAKMVGLSHAGELGSVADLANLRSRPTPDADVKGDRAAGERLLELFADGFILPPHIIAIGHRVAAGLGFIGDDPVYTTMVAFGPENNFDLPGKMRGGIPLLVIPHTSTRNRWYNDPANQQAARDALAQIFNDPRANT